MVEIEIISSLQNILAIYAVYAKNEKIPVYIGQLMKLKNRIVQHLIRRDSSIVTGANGYSLNPDYVKKVAWWEHDLFKTKKHLIAAELIAFKQLNPIIRSQSNNKEVDGISNSEDFGNKITQLFQGKPSGVLTIIDLSQALHSIAELKSRIQQLEERLK